MVLTLARVTLACLIILASGLRAEEHFTLKFATLAPEGSTWWAAMTAWSQEVERRSAGRLRLRLYAGGVSGDEPVMLRKIRFGQLHGAAISGHGIGLIHSPARVLEMPLLFGDYGEVDHVKHRLLPELRTGFQRHGFELLGLTEVGFVRFFSKAPIHRLDDLHGRRIWLWEGDPLAQALFSVSGLSPIPLSVTEVYSGLSTGLIDTVNAPPLAAIALQWFTKTPYMNELALANSIGALVVSGRFFDRLPEDLAALLVETGEATADRIARETQRDNQQSLVVLKENGVQFVPWDAQEMPRLVQLRDEAARVLAKKGYIPGPLYRRVRDMLERYRAAEAAPPDDLTRP